jgi:hypothetical protein
MKTLNDFSQIKAANFWVNVSLVSFLLLSACAKIIEQQSNILVPSPTELYYQKYFVQHKDKLDPIEGIWTENVVATLYENNKVVTRETEADRATWVIIKKGKEYVILNRYGEQNKFIASFKSAFSSHGSVTIYFFWLHSFQKVDQPILQSFLPYQE